MNWTLRERSQALETAARDGVELLVVGGGITGAGVLRDAAMRGLSALLVERDDFAGGTSSATSKMIHGGLRYLAEGQLGVTRKSCHERDTLAALNPNLVRPLPFMLCAFEGGVPTWQLWAGLTLYGMLAGRSKGKSKGTRRMLPRSDYAHYSRDLRQEGLHAVGLYHDAQVDDARFVLEVLKDARRCGAEAVNHAPLVGFERNAAGQLCGASVRDALTGHTHRLAAQRIINATGPSSDLVRGLDHKLSRQELRPAKGSHIAIRRDRLHADAAVALQASDGRHMFLCPWDDIHLIGTTDSFTDSAQAPRVTRAEVDYLLAAANKAFPGARLGPADVVSVWSGVRPLVAESHTEKPPSSVSREHRVTKDPSGLISAAGGKLTTFRLLSEELVDMAIEGLPRERRRQLDRCRTALLPLRNDDFERTALAEQFERELGLSPRHSLRLIEAWGQTALPWLQQAPPSHLEPIGETRYLHAEVAWAFSHECAANLCDVLERRLRLAIAPGQGLAELTTILPIAAEAAGWSAERTEAEAEAYRARVRERYQVSP